MNLGLYRKAIAVFLTQLVGILAQFAPGVAEHIGPESIQLLAFAASTVVALLVSDKVGGWRVNDLAKALLSAAADLGRDVPPAVVAATSDAGKIATPPPTAPPDPVQAVVAPVPADPGNVVTLRAVPADPVGG